MSKARISSAHRIDEIDAAKWRRRRLDHLVVPVMDRALGAGWLQAAAADSDGHPAALDGIIDAATAMKPSSSAPLPA